MSQISFSIPKHLASIVSTKRTLKFFLAHCSLVFACAFGIANVATALTFNIQEPTDWAVGDPNSTSQTWETVFGTFHFQNSNTPPSASMTSPSISETSKLGVLNPGYTTGSGSYYAHSGSGTYGIYANVLNHGGNSGSGGPYGPNFGTRVLIQTGATSNEGVTVIPESLHIVDMNNSILTGGANADLLYFEELFQAEEVSTSFGLVPYRESFYEFFLPGFTSDFKVEWNEVIHSSFQFLRIDTMIQEVVSPLEDADFDGDGDVDGSDFLAWQAGYSLPAGTATLVDGDANGDLSIDALDLAIWKSQYGMQSGGGSLSQASVPEPGSVTLFLMSVLFLAYRWWRPTF